MNDYSNEPLVAREVSIRRDQEQKPRNTQRNEMNSRQVERDTNAYQQTTNAFNDHAMKDALQKVRQSDVTHHEDVTRLNGTWMHNRSLKK